MITLVLWIIRIVKPRYSNYKQRKNRAKMIANDSNITVGYRNSPCRVSEVTFGRRYCEYTSNIKYETAFRSCT